MNTDPALMSLTSVAKAIEQKRVSSREATQSCLDRIAQWQPRLNAFMAIEAEAALAAADAADAAPRRGALRGVPLAHKDMYYDAGKIVTCGSTIRRDWVATTTATSLQRGEDSGSLARSAASCACLTGLISRADPAAPTCIDRAVPDYLSASRETLKGLTIGVPAAFYVDDLNVDTARILDEPVATLKREGAQVVTV